MDQQNKVIKKLHNAFKLSGYMVRREFCQLILDRYTSENLDLTVSTVFEECLKNVCSSLEKQNIIDKSIEKENIERAINMWFNAGCDEHETVFNVIEAFKFPKLQFDHNKRQFILSKKRPKLIAEVPSKINMFLERYNCILYRTQRNLCSKFREAEMELKTVDYLLTVKQCTLDHKLILGSLLMVGEGKYHLEDPTGDVELDLTHAKCHGGLFVNNTFVLVNGVYEDKKLIVSDIIPPPAEKYEDSKLCFGNLNYFGGESQLPLRESQSLMGYLNTNNSGMFFIFSDVFLDNAEVFSKFEVLFSGSQDNPPIGFIFMGNFTSETFGSANFQALKDLFKSFGELISKFRILVENCQFVFVPGMLDAGNAHIIPRSSMSTVIANEFKRFVPNAIFTSNPCRLQYCHKEIVLFRADVLVKLMQGTIHKPSKDDLNNCIARTIVSQGHLSPMSLDALPVHWAYDYTLQLYPLPNLVVIGDKSDMYIGKYMDCQVVNPGPFCDSGFQFISYEPGQDAVDECSI